MSQAVKEQMQVFLDSLDYDFEQFALDEFARWLEWRRGRAIVFVEWEFPPDVSGIWVACDGCDYVYYDADTVSIHRAHHRLHELGHILREHSGLSFVVNSDAPLQSDDREDVEAEVLAALIQKRAWRSTVTPSPEDDFVNSVEHYLAMISDSSD